MDWDKPHEMTIERLAQLARANAAMARHCGVVLKKKRIGERCVGLIIEGCVVIFSREYPFEFDFEATAHMMCDFAYALHYIHGVKTPGMGNPGKTTANVEQVVSGIQDRDKRAWKIIRGGNV